MINADDLYLDNNTKVKMKDIKYYGENNKNVADEKNELTPTSISCPNIEENDN